MDVVRAFLREHRVLEEGESLRELAYVVGGENRRLISGAGDTLYVRGNFPRERGWAFIAKATPILPMTEHRWVLK